MKRNTSTDFSGFIMLSYCLLLEKVNSLFRDKIERESARSTAVEIVVSASLCIFGICGQCLFAHEEN
jgi:hypothetical protein